MKSILYCKPEDHQRLCAERKTVLRDCGDRYAFFTEDGLEVSLVRVGKPDRCESGTTYVETQEQMDALIESSKDL